MAFIHRKKSNNVYYLIDKKYTPAEWIKLGKISRAEARVVLARYENSETYLKLDLPVLPTKITFEKLCIDYLEAIDGIRAETTVERKTYNLKKLIEISGNQKIHTITCKQVEKYFKSKNYQPNTVHTVAKDFRGVFNYEFQERLARFSILF